MYEHNPSTTTLKEKKDKMIDVSAMIADSNVTLAKVRAKMRKDDYVEVFTLYGKENPIKTWVGMPRKKYERLFAHCPMREMNLNPHEGYEPK